jgi:short-subunit dehydrogenase
VEQLGHAAIEHFGRIDTWVNNVAIGIYGRLDETDEADDRRLLDINFWGVVHGSRTALRHLRSGGGAIINVGSEVSEAVSPLLGMCSASKHAVKGFTDALRIEIEEIDQLPIAITLIQPTACNTPFPQHARNYMDEEPKLPSPMIEPQQVAEAIVNAATEQTRSKKVGVMASLNTFTANMAPSISDKMAAKRVDQLHHGAAPRRPLGSLYEASETATSIVGTTRPLGV